MLHTIDRRRALQLFAATGIAFAGGASGSDQHHAAEKSVSGEEALRLLKEGNARFVSGHPKCSYQDLARRGELSKSQHPFVTILGCSDSRVPIEMIFDQGLGDIFTVRVAGNVVSDDVTGSIEYAVEHLGTLVVVVLGHESCGAVTAALSSPAELAPEPGEVRSVLDFIKPALAKIDRTQPKTKQVELGVEANARESLRQLRAKQDWNHLAGHPVVFASAIYSLTSGKVQWLQE
jgi:carbonic anhydrase